MKLAVSPTNAYTIPALRQRLGDYVELTKPKIAVMVLITVAAGYIAAAGAGAKLVPLLHTLIGTAMDMTLSVLPPIEGLVLQVAALVVSVVANGIAGALYIGAGLGPGPRDGLMTGLARRTGWSLRLVRTGIELTVLGLGWLFGGTVGVGTLLYAFTIGPMVQFFLPMVTICDHLSNTQETTPVKA